MFDPIRATGLLRLRHVWPSGDGSLIAREHSRKQYFHLHVRRRLAQTDPGPVSEWHQRRVTQSHIVGPVGFFLQPARGLECRFVGEDVGIRVHGEYGGDSRLFQTKVKLSWVLAVIQ